MEFPKLGEQCQQTDCKQLDFLPLQCKCKMIFCRDHFNNHCLSGECKLAPKVTEANPIRDDQIYKCSEKECKKANLHEMLCTKCRRHYCIDHRFHSSCPEIDDEVLAAKIRRFEEPRKQFQLANRHLQDKITENLRKALLSSSTVKTASKIHLMRIKQRAVGPKSIPPEDRVYFAIKKPVNMEPKPVKIVKDENNLVDIGAVTLDPDLKDTIPVFVSIKWSLGRAVDSICDSCNIVNDNNKIGAVKLRLFRQLDGYCINPNKMNMDISDLIKNETILEGDKLVIEYIRTELLSSVDDSTHMFLI